MTAEPIPGRCPRCGAADCHRDSVDVGIGVMYGPYGCPCGWSEDPRYDITSGPKTESGYRVDQWGGLTPPARELGVHTDLGDASGYVCDGCGDQAEVWIEDRPLCRREPETTARLAAETEVS